MLTNVIKGFGWLTIVSGIILGIIEGNAYDPIRYSDFGWADFITYSLAGAISGVLFLAISRVLELLEEISYNTSFSRSSSLSSGSAGSTQKSSYPSTGKSDNKPSLETLSKSHTIKSLD